MADGPALSIVIPVFNGAATIGQVVDGIAALDMADRIELVLVNDASPDNSAEVCAALADSAPFPVTLINHSRNFGEHSAIMTGLRHARGDHIITMDDDLQNPPAEILRLYQNALDSGADVVYASYVRKHHSLWRNIGSRFANWSANRVLDKPRDLYLSSFRCMTRFIADRITLYDGPYPYVDGLISQNTNRFASVMVEHLPRAAGRSGYTLRKLIPLWLSIAMNFSVMPLRICTVLGFLTSLGGLVGIVWVLTDYFLHGVSAAGWATLMLFLMVFSGVQLLMLGIVGEYVGRLFLTANRRPQAVVRDIVRPRGKS